MTVPISGTSGEGFGLGQDGPVDRPDGDSRNDEGDERPVAAGTWHGLEEVPADLGGSVVVIGVFDGVHRGHQAILARARAAAVLADLPAIALTFDPNPVAVVRPDVPAPEQLVTVERRVELLREAGADAVCVVDFTVELSRMTALDFVAHVLVDRLRARRVVVGADFRFGNRAAGDAALLTELGARFGFTVEALALVTDGPDTSALGEPRLEWSSTAVRRLVAAGEVAAAARILGRPHRVEGVVVAGDRRGRTLGFPTANLETGRSPRPAVPADGVYSGWLVRDGGEKLPAAVSVGTNPTFDGDERRVEAYVLDRDDLDLYGEHVAVDFVSRLRAMERFDSVPELVSQMDRDVAQARRQLTG